MLVQVSVADVMAWDSLKEIYGNGPEIFETAEVEARTSPKSMGLI